MKTRKYKDNEEDVNKILIEIINTKPSFYRTQNSYVRSCLYEALEIYSLQYGRIWVKRRKEMIPIYAKYPHCIKHGCGLYGSCDCCSDPWCCGPHCEKCNDWRPYSKCRYAVDEGDLMYNAKITVGLEIFYNKSEIGKLKMRSFP